MDSQISVHDFANDNQQSALESSKENMVDLLADRSRSPSFRLPTPDDNRCQVSPREYADSTNPRGRGNGQTHLTWPRKKGIDPRYEHNIDQELDDESQDGFCPKPRAMAKAPHYKLSPYYTTPKGRPGRQFEYQFIKIKGLDSQMSTPFDVYRPVIRQQHQELDEVSDLEYIRSRPTISQLDVTTIWINTPWSAAEMLCSMEPIFLLTMEDMIATELQQLALWKSRDLTNLPSSEAGIQRGPNGSQLVDFSLDELIYYMLHKSFWQNPFPEDTAFESNLQELILLFLISCDCIESTSPNGRIDAGINLRMEPSYELSSGVYVPPVAHVVRKLDFLEFPGLDACPYEGSELLIIPIFHRGAHIKTTEKFTDIHFELLTTLPWLTWDNRLCGFRGIVPIYSDWRNQTPELNSQITVHYLPGRRRAYSLLCFDIKAVLVERHPWTAISLKRTARARLALRVIPCADYWSNVVHAPPHKVSLNHAFDQTLANDNQRKKAKLKSVHQRQKNSLELSSEEENNDVIFNGPGPVGSPSKSSLKTNRMDEFKASTRFRPFEKEKYSFTREEVQALLECVRRDDKSTPLSRIKNYPELVPSAHLGPSSGRKKRSNVVALRKHGYDQKDNSWISKPCYRSRAQKHTKGNKDKASESTVTEIAPNSTIVYDEDEPAIEHHQNNDRNKGQCAESDEFLPEALERTGSVMKSDLMIGQISKERTVLKKSSFGMIDLPDISNRHEPNASLTTFLNGEHQLLQGAASSSQEVENSEKAPKIKLELSGQQKASIVGLETPPATSSSSDENLLEFSLSLDELDKNPRGTSLDLELGRRQPGLNPLLLGMKSVCSESHGDEKQRSSLHVDKQMVQENPDNLSSLRVVIGKPSVTSERGCEQNQAPRAGELTRPNSSPVLGPGEVSRPETADFSAVVQETNSLAVENKAEEETGKPGEGHATKDGSDGERSRLLLKASGGQAFVEEDSASVDIALSVEAEGSSRRSAAARWHLISQGLPVPDQSRDTDERISLCQLDEKAGQVQSETPREDNPLTDLVTHSQQAELPEVKLVDMKLVEEEREGLEQILLLERRIAFKKRRGWSEDTYGMESDLESLGLSSSSSGWGSDAESKVDVAASLRVTPDGAFESSVSRIDNETSPKRHHPSSSDFGTDANPIKKSRKTP